MGDNADILGQALGIGGVLDDTLRVGPEITRVNEAQFDRAEGRQQGLRGSVLGDPNLDQVPQGIIDRARQTGEAIIKRADGSFIIAAQGDVPRLTEGQANEG